MRKEVIKVLLMTAILISTLNFIIADDSNSTEVVSSETEGSPPTRL